MTNSSSRVRKTPEERRNEILEASIDLIARKGFNGIKLSEVAQAVGISSPGLLHYVGNKDGLLSEIITSEYDAQGTPEDFLTSGLPGSNPNNPAFPAYYRYLVQFNAKRRKLVQLYVVLESESFSEEHPLHSYFMNRPSSVWEKYSGYSWKIPPVYGGWENMRFLVRQTIEALDGIQLRWLRKPPIDMYGEWLSFEKLLFPSPVWDGYRE